MASRSQAHALQPKTLQISFMTSFIKEKIKHFLKKLKIEELFFSKEYNAEQVYKCCLGSKHHTMGCWKDTCAGTYLYGGTVFNAETFVTLHDGCAGITQK